MADVLKNCFIVIGCFLGNTRIPKFPFPSVLRPVRRDWFNWCDWSERIDWRPRSDWFAWIHWTAGKHWASRLVGVVSNSVRNDFK